MSTKEFFRNVRGALKDYFGNKAIALWHTFDDSEVAAAGYYQCVDLDGRAWLWTPRGMATNRLIITAHGLRRTNTSFKIEYNVNLHFYSRDKFSVNDPGLARFYSRGANSVEDLGINDPCFNYILTKYTSSATNRHNTNNETYTSVNAIMSHNNSDSRRRRIQNANNIGMVAKANSIQSFQPPSILTIRNRQFMAAVNLKWVLDTLERKGHHFNDIDCLFCRNTLWTGAVAVMSGLSGGDKYSDDVAIN
ncbi:putative adhesin [Microbulbifer sp. VAAF005]|uniref:putative adhesin n=1 Tax=Microbulbifer sp. VAAF005 TaxID=3034230 RepID=UPI0024AE5BA8|nr:hypothetical protein [Microbulbifer sp. VAAF005]WHI47502.1 hypothetical protein P0078_03700 [Microbulbifer sp. VAAF005]